MAFSLNLLTLPSEADSLIQTAQRDKWNLEHRKESFLIRTENSAENSAELAAELATATASLESTNSLLLTLPEGDVKEAQVTKKMELELRIRKLSKTGSKLGAVAVVEQAYDVDQLDRQIAGMDAFIEEATARKAEL